MRVNNFATSFFGNHGLKVVDLLRVGLIISLLFNVACIPLRTTLDAIYLIPQGYEGVVVIFFDQPNGIEPESEGGQYVYKIPADGLLRVKTHGQGGLIVSGEKYFYVSENGEREEINYLESQGYVKTTAADTKKSFDNISEDEKNNAVFVMYCGGIGGFKIGDKPIRYSSFLVGKPKNADFLYNEKEKRLNNMQKSYHGL